MQCRFCSNELTDVFVDLGAHPASNSFLTKEKLNEPEIYYPLKTFVCNKCFLVQVDEVKRADEIFNDEYVYFSSYSKSWVEHARQYVEMITQRLGLDGQSRVMEIASNDGYLLQFFKQKQIPCLGVEPSKNTSQAARQKGIEVITEFFNAGLAEQLVRKDLKADLILGINVLAHVPDINSFVKGLKTVLKSGGVVTMEFPHLMRLVEQNQFDTIYHEHFSYFSFHTVERIFAEQGLVLFDVDELPTHGGSIRIYAKHPDDNIHQVSDKVKQLRAGEKNKGMLNIAYYTDFQQKVYNLKYDLLDFLVKQKKKGRKIIGYGAAAKGNTLLNYCGIKSDMIDFVADISPHKQNKFLPGSRIPVMSPDVIKQIKPDCIIILPWNLKEEISAQIEYTRQWGCRLVTPIPEIDIF